LSRGDDFWSRRRAGVEAEKATADATAEAKSDAEEMAELEKQSDEEILAALNLPDPDTLKQGDDVAAFMARMVPDRLRRRALRALFRLNPVLANVDGLVDYGEDFTDAALVVENLQTTYQVGKGMLAHVQEMERKARLAAEALEDDVYKPSIDRVDNVDVVETTLEAEADADSDKEPLAEDPQPENAEIAESVSAPVVSDKEEAADLTTPAPRRMQFSFKDQTV